MQMYYQKKNNNKKIKKSQLLLLGSLFIFIGSIALSSNYLGKIKEDLYSEMKISMFDRLNNKEANQIVETPIVDNVTTNTDSNTNIDNNANVEQKIDYSKYLGVLEIPRIGLKRGFYNTNSKYNNIQYNVTMVKGSKMPDVNNGNLILMAHSGDAYISFFAYLYKLQVGDIAYVTYQGKKYKYQLANIYNVDKNGSVTIVRNYNKTTLTLITCTKDDDFHQTVYILELV